MSPEVTEGIRTAAELARRPLVLVALEADKVIADRRFPPGASVTVGSNSGCDLIVPAKFELTSYALISHGSKLHLARPLFVQTSVWVGDAAVPLRGFVRDLLRSHAELLEPVSLASERFLVRYATGIALLGRFVEPTETEAR